MKKKIGRYWYYAYSEKKKKWVALCRTRVMYEKPKPDTEFKKTCEDIVVEKYFGYYNCFFSMGIKLIPFYFGDDYIKLYPYNAVVIKREFIEENMSTEELKSELKSNEWVDWVHDNFSDMLIGDLV